MYVSVCVYMCASVCTYTHVHVCVWIRVDAPMCVHLYLMARPALGHMCHTKHILAPTGLSHVTYSGSGNWGLFTLFSSAADNSELSTKVCFLHFRMGILLFCLRGFSLRETGHVRVFLESNFFMHDAVTGFVRRGVERFTTLT